MTKAEYIERYGLERYERRKTQNAAWNRKRYQNDSEFRESEKVRTHIYKKERWRDDLEYREFANDRNKTRNKARYHNDPEYQKSVNERNKVRNKVRYHNDPEFRKCRLEQTRARRQASYVEDGRIDLIKNYEFALSDEFKDWDIHHKLEIHEDYNNSTKHLKLMNLYYNRPPSELIWLRRSEHLRIHAKARRSN